MDVFKSWLVANVEVIYIILTVLLVAIAGMVSLSSDAIAASGLNIYYFISIAFVSLFLCIWIVFFIKNGFLSLLTMALLFGIPILIMVTEPEVEGGNQEPVVAEQVQHEYAASPDEENEFDILFSQGRERFKGSYLIWPSVVAVLVGLLLAIYANRNFDDVVSRRFFYRNSDVSVFEVQWKYTFNRFYAGFIACFALGLEIVLCVILKP